MAKPAPTAVLPYEAARPRYVGIPGTSMADVEPPHLSFTAGDLSVSFDDWLAGAVRFTFRGVAAFRWQESATAECGAYEVLSSPWIAELAEAGALERGATYRHWSFCFHPAEAVLDVVATEMS